MNFFHPKYFNRENITKVSLHLVSHLVFWVWNLVFIALMYFWLLPQVGFELIQAARTGEIDPTFTVSFVALMIVPLACTLLGFFRLRKHPILLMWLFFGVEAPLFTLCLLRLFLIRELTLATGVVLGLVVVAIAMYAIELLSGYAAYRPRLAKMQMASHSLMLLVGIYVGTLLLLYSLTAMGNIAISTFTGLLGLDWGWVVSGLFEAIGYVLRHPFEAIAGLVSGTVGIGFGFLGLSSILIFLAMPYVFTSLYIQAWIRIRKAFSRQYGEQKSWAITGTTLALSCLLFVLVQNQPQIKAFNLLANDPAIASEVSQAGLAQSPEALMAARQAQIEQSAAIKSGLTNAYLYHYRYLSPWSESNYLGQMYIDTFEFSEGAAQFIQNFHNGLLSPFLYRGDRADSEKAAELYAQFFDEPIQKGEQTAIQKALEATANRDETQAGLLNVDQKVVRLASQSVSVNEQGDWATIEIQEEYENPTIEDQEIFYSFSLPESAAISGLWLGTADNLKQFPFVVSPRGAAQKVYKAEVERAKFQRPTDPALLEQVGPRQYRLRVFPIPRASDDRTPGELHLTMSYQVMQQGGAKNPQWPLPQLTEKRNIFWTKDTDYIRESGSAKRSEENWENEWFEAAIPAKRTKATSHTVMLPEGYQVTATPFTNQEQKLPTDKQFAVMVDSSYSMGEHKAALSGAIAQLTASDNQLDFFIPIAGAIANKTVSAVTVDNISFYGSLQPADMLRQFAATKRNPNYDAVLLLTDEGSYELAKSTSEAGNELPDLAAPLWIVHVDGKLPSAYEDGLLQQLQASQGGVETDVTAALRRIALSAADGRALDGYTWKVETAEAGDTNAKASDSMAAIAARQLIYQQSQTLDMTQVSALDSVHAVAKQTGVVTPYSSMLVLVDERQREALRQAEADDDRFEREVEDGTDELTTPDNPMSIPEPGQVLSLMVGAIALVLLKRKSKAAH